MTPSEQRQYVLDRVTEALKLAPDVKYPDIPEQKFSGPHGTYSSLPEPRGAYAKQVEQFGNVVIMIPDSTTFTVLNTCEALQRFRKAALKMPKTDRPGSYSKTNPAGPPRGRVTDLEGEYIMKGYNPFPKTLKLSKKDAEEWGVTDGWSRTRGMIIKAPTTGEKPKKAFPGFPPHAVGRINGSIPMHQVHTMTTTYVAGGKPVVVCEAAEGVHGTFAAKLLDVIHAAFPGHSSRISETCEYLAVVGGEVVALLAPYPESMLMKVLSWRRENDKSPIRE